jgi:hypothetical protein
MPNGLPRTPPSKQPKHTTRSFEREKRKNEEMLEESPPASKGFLVELLTQNQNAIVNQVTAQIAPLTTQISEIAKSQEETKAAVEGIRDEVNAKFAENGIAQRKIMDDVSDLQAKMNDFEQEKLNANMEITGMDERLMSTGKALTEIVKEIFNQLQIAYNDQMITKIYARTFSDKSRAMKSVITIVFSNVDEKTRVMQEKFQRDKGKVATIFFSHSLTKRNRSLYMRARQIAKKINAKAYVAAGRVYMKNQDDRKGIPIKCDQNLDEIEAKKVISSFSKPTQVGSSSQQ